MKGRASWKPSKGKAAVGTLIWLTREKRGKPFSTDYWFGGGRLKLKAIMKNRYAAQRKHKPVQAPGRGELAALST